LTLVDSHIKAKPVIFIMVSAMLFGLFFLPTQSDAIDYSFHDPSAGNKDVDKAVQSGIESVCNFVNEAGRQMNQIDANELP
jgi:hypothetical protein